MARKETVDVPQNTVVELTNADVSGAISIQIVSGSFARVIGTTDATTPALSDFEKGFIMRQLDGPPFGTTLADMFPGAGYVRLWALSPSLSGCIFVVYHG